MALVPACGAAGTDPVILIEFKVFDPDRDETLADTVGRARAQMEDRRSSAGFAATGFCASRILTYGIALRGKEVLVG